tara:strand:+ start:267 stop:389 length:123 start_codon:yes stop_codon:yes gene_type:complete
MELIGLFFIGIPASIFFFYILLRFRMYRMKEREEKNGKRT